MLDSIRIVLVRTSHPGNIGAAARAMKTMGLQRLDLVDPLRFPDPEASARAAGAVDLLERAQVHAELRTALADCGTVYGLSARRRGVPLRTVSPREAAAEAAAAASRGPVAFLFGNERTGLENEELLPCVARVSIPAQDDFASLNLGAAVQIMAYELRLAALELAPQGDPDAPARPADIAALEGLHGHLAQTLEDIEFHKGRSPRTVLTRLRRLFQRAGLDQREVRILRGILSEAQRQARLARKNL